MKTLKSILWVTLILIGVETVIGQDIMLKVNPKEYVFNFNDLSIKNQNISFTNVSDGNMYTYPFIYVNKIVFNNQNPNEIHLTVFEIDSINCAIETIAKKSILYKLPNENSLREIKKENVLGILFNHDQYNYVINNFKDKFLRNGSIKRDETYKLLTTEGVEYIIYNLNLNKRELQFDINHKGQMIKTSINIDNVAYISSSDSITYAPAIPTDDFIMTTGGRFQSVQISGIYNEKIEYSFVANNQINNFKTPKETLGGIFFFNYSKPMTTFKPRNVSTTSSNNPSGAVKVKFDISAGIGYLLAAAPEGASSEMKKYINEMRLSTAFDASITFLVTEKLGVGFMYNFFSTSNSVANLGEDNNTVGYTGITLMSTSALPSQKGFFYSSVSLGYLSWENKAKALGQPLNVKGNTVGLYSKLGVDFLLNENMCLGINAGLLLGSLNKATVNGMEVEFNDPENLSRFDTMIGLKFYF
jgi:hypothetical protein